MVLPISNLNTTSKHSRLAPGVDQRKQQGPGPSPTSGSYISLAAPKCWTRKPKRIRTGTGAQLSRAPGWHEPDEQLLLLTPRRACLGLSPKHSGPALAFGSRKTYTIEEQCRSNRRPWDALTSGAVGDGFIQEFPLTITAKQPILSASIAPMNFSMTPMNHNHPNRLNRAVRASCAPISHHATANPNQPHEKTTLARPLLTMMFAALP
jgi:hypothetical protein